MHNKCFQGAGPVFFPALRPFLVSSLRCFGCVWLGDVSCCALIVHSSQTHLSTLGGWGVGEAGMAMMMLGLIGYILGLLFCVVLYLGVNIITMDDKVLVLVIRGQVGW